MNLNNYLSLDATEMANLINKKEVSPKELLEIAFKQLEKVNPELNIATHTRKERVLNEAKDFKSNLPFAGVPLMLKDISQSFKGEKITSGSKLMKDNISNHDSYLVSKLRQAGFLVMGHTATPEFGLKNITEAEVNGPTRNPWNKHYSPGGSSGGSAAAIASGVVPMAGASDGGGSIRIPASFSGLFGLKPTRGKMPVGPGVGRQWQGASIDFMLSRTIRDSAAMLDLLQVTQASAAFQAPLYSGIYIDTMRQDFKKPLKIAYTTKSPVSTPVSDDAKKAVEKTVKWLEKQGHHVEEKEIEVDGIQLMKNYYLMNSGEISMVTSQLEKGLGRAITKDDVEIETWALNEAGKSVSAAEFSASLSSWDVAAEQMAIFHDTYDFYVTPASAYTAPEVGELTLSQNEQAQLREKILMSGPTQHQDLIYEMFLPSLTYTPFTQLANLTGQPAMSLPVFISDEGLPLGVQVTASKNKEYNLLKLAYQIEKSSLWQGMKGNPYF